jgi:Ca2+-binding RTX toxin-like protein
METLEGRRHLAGVVASLDQGVLTIQGTSRDDAISVAAGARQFTVFISGQAGPTYANSAVRLVRINAGRGNDSILLSSRLRVRASVEAGPGNDRVGGGGQSDTLFGQQGNDTLVSNGGADYLDGGSEDDYLEGFSVLHGGGGDDTARMALATYRSGIEHETVVDANDQADQRIFPSAGRLKFALTVRKNPADLVTITGPTARDDGTREIVFSVETRPGGDTEDYFTREIDITGSDQTGLLLTRLQPDGSRVTIPIFLPRGRR